MRTLVAYWNKGVWSCVIREEGEIKTAFNCLTREEVIIEARHRKVESTCLIKDHSRE